MQLDSATALATPVGFARAVLGLDLYPWQERVLWDIAVGRRTVVLAAANGSGKTSMIAAPLLLWHCAVFPGGEVVTTAGVYRQVKEQLWQTIRRFHSRLGSDWKINETDLVAPNGSRAIGFSTDDPYKFEGWHGGANGNLLMIFDEAKAIPNSIFEAARRCNAKSQRRFLIMSSTGSVAGEFGAALTRKKHLYSTHTITAYDCPHIKPAESEALIAEYGREHPLVRSAIFSELMDDAAHEYIIPRGVIERCRAEPPAPERSPWRGQLWAFIDWAAGGDECVIAIMNGCEVLPLICWRDADTLQSVGKAVRELRLAGVPQGQVFADHGGLGIPMNRQMAELGFPVVPINNGAKSRSADYENRGAEHWHRAGVALQKKQVILPPDEILDAQLSTRKLLITPHGKLGMESKGQMRLRGIPSPDRADAVVAVIALATQQQSISRHQREISLTNDYRDEDSGGVEGLDAGG